jgi:molybdopterin synthase catalytic subunit
VGEAAVAIAVAAPHRGEAFEACRYVIEELKRRVPIWKREWYADGSSDWVNPAAARAGNAPEEVAIGSAGGRHG